METLGISPGNDIENSLRSLYGVGLRVALTTVRMNKEIGDYNKLKLKNLDSVLEIIEKNLDEKNLGWSLELHGCYDKIPSRLDLKKKFDELVLEDVDKLNLKDRTQYVLEYLRRGNNYLKNCRRVIYRVLNNEPLYLTRDICLIPEEVDIFKRFADKLSHPLKRDLYNKEF